jgi:hypothetical protein
MTAKTVRPRGVAKRARLLELGGWKSGVSRGTGKGAWSIEPFTRGGARANAMKSSNESAKCTAHGTIRAALQGLPYYVSSRLLGSGYQLPRIFFDRRYGLVL